MRRRRRPFRTQERVWRCSPLPWTGCVIRRGDNRERRRSEEVRTTRIVPSCLCTRSNACLGKADVHIFTRVLEEENVPDLPTSDEGREVRALSDTSLHQRLLTCQCLVRDYQGSLYPGSQLQSKERGADHTHQDFNIEKGWGFIIRKAGGDNARFFDKACTAGLIPEKGLCVSFVLEQTDKGPSAKDLREEDPERVRRVTAEVYYGRVDVSPFHMLVIQGIIQADAC